MSDCNGNTASGEVTNKSTPRNLPDEVLLQFWQSVQGPNAQLTGPLIRFAGLVLREALTCFVPPPGWACTRPAGHDGPCAAIPSGESAPTTPSEVSTG
jgi:hypothetical protein